MRRTRWTRAGSLRRATCAYMSPREVRSGEYGRKYDAYAWADVVEFGGLYILRALLFGPLPLAARWVQRPDWRTLDVRRCCLRGGAGGAGRARRRRGSGVSSACLAAERGGKEVAVKEA
ncbi:uncharacterized protein A4U43_C07F35930 [Asparagus officinalis]|uniref:Uncharacterized protein n=1 Tax=Asparagus officinalis TaxID=4686 RepID=A0A5P1EHF0_ASPOF|nr:uncharacterized protein A4U43_C07F35930 [Asparagus officinalis]